jgi:methyl-accepting chemotaxis protein
MFNGYRGTAGGVHQTLEVQGSARQGDSGGPIFNAQGELAGVLWGTDGSTTVGSYNGRICQFTQTDRYLFPWNADLAKEKYRQQNPPGTPPSSPGSPIGDEIREKLASLAREVQSLGRDVATLEEIADAAKEAAAKAETEAGKAFAEAVGVKSEVGRAASAATAAQEQAATAHETAEKLDKGLLERVGGFVRTTAQGLVTRYGGWTLGIAGVVIGVIIWLVRKDILDKIRHGDPLLIEKLAAMTSNKLDDRIAQFVAQRVESYGAPKRDLREEVQDLRSMVSGLRDVVGRAVDRSMEAPANAKTT